MSYKLLNMYLSSPKIKKFTLCTKSGIASYLSMGYLKYRVLDFISIYNSNLIAKPFVYLKFSYFTFPSIKFAK